MNRSPHVEAPADCVEVREARSRGEPLRGALAAHAEACPVCAASSAPPAWDEDAAFAALGAAVAEERGFVAALRNASTRTRVLGAATTFLAALVAIGVFWSRGRRAPVPVDRVLVVVTVLAVLLVATLRLVLRPLQAPPASQRTTTLAVALGVAVPFVFAVLGNGDTAGSGAPWRCFVTGGLLGGAFVLLLRAFDRGELVARRTALVAAAAGGLAANAALELHCSSTEPAHLVLGHAMVGVALLALLAVRPSRGT